MWFFLALASAIFYAFRGILEKKVIHHTNKYVLGFAIRFFALPFFFLPFLFAPSLFIPLSDLPLQFWIAVFTVCIICTPLETIFYYEALKEEEVSLVVPILSLSPVVTLILSIFILKELPNLYGILGIILIVFGIYALKLGHAREGILQPLHHLRNSRGVRLMFLVLLSLGFGSIIDKIGVTSSNAYMYTLIHYIILSLSLFLIAFFKAKPHLKEVVTFRKEFSAIGFIVALYTLPYMIALASSYASYVVAIRSVSVLLTIIFAYLFFKEKNIKQKIFAAILIILGLICIKALG
jgi:uncharacterized membrane protein